MIKLFSLSALLLIALPAIAQDVLPLRSCARDLTMNIAGERHKDGFSSTDNNSFYFLNCDENWDLGQDHYVFTPSGVYYFFIKSHKDYKGGFEPTQFRLSIENSTYYFKTNIAGGMGDLFDANGKNLDLSESDSHRMSIDPSIKNQVINYYMKTLTGKSEMNSAIIAEAATEDRLIKAHSCIQQKIIKLGSSLVNVYKARRDYRQVTPEVLNEYNVRVRGALLNSSCIGDFSVAEKFKSLLNEIES